MESAGPAPVIRGYCKDTETGLVTESYALIFAPKRKRERFPENCVFIQASEHDALENADPEKKLYPAKVVGPARSSEGVRLFYLVCWLDE